MTSRNNPLFWSFGAGTWSGVRLRISWLLPILLVGLVLELKPALGAALFGVIIVSVLLHEICHILAARALEGSGDEILLWPLGGLAFCEATSARNSAIIAAAGPLSNLLVCGLSLPAVLVSPHLKEALNPLMVPIASEAFGGQTLISDLQVLTFWFNWMTLLANLIPAYPLDGGQILRSALVSRMGAGMGTELAIRIAIGFAIVLAMVDLIFFKHIILMGVAFLIVILAMQEAYQVQASETYDDSFMGYDFSQGYTSLEKSEKTRPEPRAGLLQRWLSRRKAEKQRRLEALQQQTDQQLDAILAKVHDQGLGSLSLSEKRLLKRASNRYRSKGTEPD